MSTEMSPSAQNILRFALGVTLSLILALVFQWPLAHATPVLVGMLLGPPAQPLPGKVWRVMLLCLAVAYLIGFVLVLLSRNYPLVSVWVIGLLLFALFVKAGQGLNLLVVVFFMLAVLVYPLVALVSQQASQGAAVGFIVTMLVALLVSQLCFIVLPPNGSPPGKKPPPAKPEQHQLLRNAALATAAVLPLLIYFMLFDKQGELLTLIFVAFLAVNPSLSGGFKASLGLVMANIIGGISAVIIYELLVIAPWLPVYLLFMLAVCLVFGKLIFTSPKGALFATALNAILLLIGATTSSAGGEVSSDFYSRLLLIMAAGIYLSLSFMLFTSLGWLKTGSSNP